MNGIGGKDCWRYTYQVHKFDATLFFLFFLPLQKENGVDNRQQEQKKKIKVIITITFWTLLY